VAIYALCIDLTCEAYQALPITERAPEDVAFANLAMQEKWRQCPKVRLILSAPAGEPKFIFRKQCSAMVELKVRICTVRRFPALIMSFHFSMGASKQTFQLA
jgi:hypothetical protein